MAPRPLSPTRLRRTARLPAAAFRTTVDLDAHDVALGQADAVEAIEFAIGMKRAGYNLFVVGTSGTGRHALARRLLERHAIAARAPDDWVYVNDFTTSHTPRALALPAGRAGALRADMERFVQDVFAAIPALFESDEFRTRQQAVDEEFKELQEAAFQEVQAAAESKGLALVRTPTGLALAPMQNNEVMAPEAFNQLPAPVRKQIEEDLGALQGKLAETVKRIPSWEAERRRRLRKLAGELAAASIASALAPLRQAFADVAAVGGYLDTVAADIVENVEAFLAAAQAQAAGAAAGGAAVPMGMPGPNPAALMKRYRVNVMVANDAGNGAPVVSEDLPSQPHLIGSVEYAHELGALVTDFSQIKPGALHRANGGFLVLDALRLLQQPMAWESLKRAIQASAIKIESPTQMMGLASTVSLEPEPIPLDVKIVLIGDHRLYYALAQGDPDFNHLFKVAADFEEDMPWTAESQLDYAAMLAMHARRCELRPLDRAAVARVIEQASRIAGDNERLSLRTGPIDDLLREADHFAGEAGHARIRAADVTTAIEARIRRADRIRRKSHEGVLRETVMIATEGAAVGQINGLAVLDLGNFAFGKPSRITASVRMGTGEVIDIERRVELGGPLHSKGVLILSAFLAARFADDHPPAFSASLAFEQSYGGVDGDSASSTELYALLSALSEVAIDQGLAVTGSVNQNGEVQAIGGANEKIEGFFDICQARGLTGGQGVLIPAANVKHLMLREDVVAAARAGRFRIHAVRTIDEGIEILTGTAAGRRRADGTFPPGSINDRVRKRLLAFAETRRDFAKTGQGGKAAETGDDGNGGGEGGAGS